MCVYVYLSVSQPASEKTLISYWIPVLCGIFEPLWDIWTLFSGCKEYLMRTELGLWKDWFVRCTAILLLLIHLLTSKSHTDITKT